MKIIQRPQDTRALHTRFSIPRIFLGALVAGLFSLTGAQTFGALAQQAYLKALNPGDSDHFGHAVAVWGDTMVVGVPDEDSDASDPNGDPNNNLAPDSGAAYVFVRSGTNWIQQAYLKANLGAGQSSGAYHRFGAAVAIDYNTIVIGAPAASDGGSAYIFTRPDVLFTNWSQRATLKASNAGGNFGAAVAVSQPSFSVVTVVVGAPSESSNGTGVNGNQTDYSSFNSGAAYVFFGDINSLAGGQQAYLKAGNAGAGDRFGVSVGISGHTVVVGAADESSNATGVNGDGGNNLAYGAGAAYVFARAGVTWSQQAYLKASNTETGFTYPGDQFGHSVAVSGDLVVVSAPNEASSATGVNGNAADNSATSAGAAYVFARNGAAWTQQAYLKASNAEGGGGFGPGDQFGISVAVSGGWVVVGAPNEDSSSPGVNGSQANGTNFNSGAAYLFTRSGTNWSQQDYLKASTPDGGPSDLVSGDNFGSAVAVSGQTIAVGAFQEESNAAGVDGNQADNSLSQAGAAYVIAVGAAYYSEPPPGASVDLKERGSSWKLVIGNAGTFPLTIQSIQITDGTPVLLSFTEHHDDHKHVVLPYTIPVGGPVGEERDFFLDVGFIWKETNANFRSILTVTSDDPAQPVAEYDIIGLRLEETPEAVIIFGLNQVGALMAPSRKHPGPNSLLALPQTATFTMGPNTTQSLTTGIPVFLGGGSVVMTNFTGSFTVSLSSIPNDTNRAAVRVESGTFTAPSFTLPSGLVSGPNVLTFGPPEQSSGFLYLTNGHYEVTATATITNSLIPDGVTVWGNYTGIYNVTNDQISLESDSRDLFEVSERVQLNHAPNGLWLTWANTNAVEEATSITGPWRTVTNAVSPYLVVTTNFPQQFFRLRLPEP